MNRVAVLIPSRDRPEKLKQAIVSVLETASAADVLAYVDEDQRGDYEPMLGAIGGGERVRVAYGPRVGPVASANVLVEDHPHYSAYGLITDDTRMVTWGWDAWLLDAISQFPGRICVVSPRHNLGEHVDMPFVSREWLDLVGFYACPEMFHYCWPILTGLIGEMTAIVHAPEQSFCVHHDGLPHTNLEAQAVDAQKFFHYVALRLPVHVENIRNAMARAQGVA